MTIRKNWQLEELQKLHDLPLMELISRAHATHIQFHPIGEIQVCTLLSIKTGGCPEDCKYCSQSSRYKTAVSPRPMLSYEQVLTFAKKAIEKGVTRICLGAALREVKDNKQFDEILQMIKGVTKLGVEVCCTLGLLNESQAIKLKEAGLHSYNHNLDTSENFYKTIITTRSYQDRLNTLDAVAKAELKACCGVILGLGEELIDRLKFLLTISQRDPAPESVPINQLSPVAGTPLENQPKIPFWEVLRMVATTRIVLPKAMVRLSAGRINMSFEQQALCFFAGANSIHADEMLTIAVPNIPRDQDEEMFQTLGLKRRPSFAGV